ncbi:MAG: hypothetical protein ACOY0R_07425 [Chloroflexota bacterium]
MTYNQFIRYVLTFEAVVLNAGTGAMCLIAPQGFIAQFSAEPLTAVGYEFIRWYGVLLWVLTVYVLRLLPLKDDRALAPAVEALLFGDLAHLVVSYLFFQAIPVWSFAFIVMLVFTTTLAVLRSIWVYRFHTQKL